jgi:hypothetical protein
MPAYIMPYARDGCCKRGEPIRDPVFYQVVYGGSVLKPTETYQQIFPRYDFPIPPSKLPAYRLEPSIYPSNIRVLSPSLNRSVTEKYIIEDERREPWL